MKKQLIDADALIRFMNERHKTLVDERGWYDHYTSGYEDAITDVEEAPIVDAVPVVRCKECKHRGDPKECYMCFTEVEDIEGGRMYKFTDMTRSDGFCHKGAKMDAKEDNHAQTD